MPENFRKYQFASDNTSAISPEAWEAMERVNRDYPFAPAYGDDPVTKKAEGLIRDLFETDCDVFFVFNGSAANSLALAAMCQPYYGILCHPFSHVDNDEANAPEFFTGGAKLILADGKAGKIEPASIDPALARGHGIHSAKISVLTLTQSTEVGTNYTPDELRNLTAIRERPGCEQFRFHMDGARFANAVAALDVAPSEITWKAGIDVLTFGGAKNGFPATEALVFFDRALAREFAWRRKRGGQLASKMRYQSAPWIGMIESGAWLANARYANSCAQRLGAGLAAIDGIELRYPVESNGVFVTMTAGVAEGLIERGWHFYPFSQAGAWRFMCSWNTDGDAIEEVLAESRELVQTLSAAGRA